MKFGTQVKSNGMENYYTVGTIRIQAVRTLPHMLKCIYKASIVSKSSELEVEKSSLGGIAGIAVWF